MVSVEVVVLGRCYWRCRSAGRTVVVRLAVSDTVSPCTVISSLIPSGQVSRKLAQVWPIAMAMEFPRHCRRKRTLAIPREAMG